MRYDNLPIYRSSINLCVYIETIVKGFDKYHKYTIDKSICFLASSPDLKKISAKKIK